MTNSILRLVGCLGFCVLSLWHSTVWAQSESELIYGDWHCDVGSNDPMLIQLKLDENENADDEPVTMVQLKDGEPTGSWSNGRWFYEDVDYNDDDQAVVTIKVTWTRNNSSSDKQYSVRFTFLTDDKAEVRWGDEEMRVWTRVKTEDDDTEATADAKADSGTREKLKTPKTKRNKKDD